MSFKGQDCINIARVRGRGANGIQRSRLYRFCLDIDPIWLWMHHWAGDIVSSHISLLLPMFITLYKYHLSHWTLYIRCAVIRFESNDWSINVFWFTLSIWVYICVYIFKYKAPAFWWKLSQYISNYPHPPQTPLWFYTQLSSVLSYFF